jgi:Fur family transcriptional regulator, ferric uptake regulator
VRRVIIHARLQSSLNHPLAQESPLETEELKRAGLKVTHPRMRILEVMETSGMKHVTAEDVYKKMLESQDDIGLATIYRVLNQFEAAGIVVRHNFEGGMSVYELDRGGHHDHMVCVETGKVIEFESMEIERLQREVAAAHGYELDDHRLVLYVRPKKSTQGSARHSDKHELKR